MNMFVEEIQTTTDLADDETYSTWIDDNMSVFLTMKDRGLTMCFLTEQDLDELIEHLAKAKLALRAH